jgi:hypothetical protein
MKISLFFLVFFISFLFQHFVQQFFFFLVLKRILKVSFECRISNSHDKSATKKKSREYFGMFYLIKLIAYDQDDNGSIDFI